MRRRARHAISAPAGCDTHMPRLFIGLTVPAAVAAPLAESVAVALRGAGPAGGGLRVYPARDLHLTLCFIGELGVAQHGGIPRLERALVDETRGLAAPELRITGIGAFPDFDAPRVLWAGVVDETGAEGRLTALHNRALTAALGVGWRRPAADLARPFRPHVTLARLAPETRSTGPHGGTGGAPECVNLEAFQALRPRGTWVASEVALFESDPQHPEARYRVIADAPLAVRPG
jgi:2'-5' RNA ligase